MMSLYPGFTARDEFLGELYLQSKNYLGGECSMAYSFALLILVNMGDEDEADKNKEEEDESQGRLSYMVLGMPEVAAIPSYRGEKGRLILSGSISEPGSSSTAVTHAVTLIRDHRKQLTKIMGGRHASVEVGEMAGRKASVSTNKGSKRAETSIKGSDMDIWVHEPLGRNSFNMCASMVLAFVTMMWRKPSLHNWTFVGGIDTDGELIGYFHLGKDYLDLGLNTLRFHTIVVPECNRLHILDSLEVCKGHGDADYDYEVKGDNELIYRARYEVEEEDDGEERKGEKEKVEKTLRVLFCKTMLEMIKEAYDKGWRTGNY